MLEKVQLDKVLFLDIETVPQVYQFNTLDEKSKKKQRLLFIEKIRNTI